MNVLFVGDVVGRPGRRALKRLLPDLRSRLGASFVIVNGENAAGGLGITRKTGAEMLAAGADVITLGNHAFAKSEALEYVVEESRLLRPANFPPGVPGRGFGVYCDQNGRAIAVANILGRTFMEAVDCPFRAADQVLDQTSRETRLTLFDAHAEATSEKYALGWYLDGRATAVLGTHTHVQTSDERVMPGGTAYITDVGMTGTTDSILGMDRDVVIRRFVMSVPRKFAPADGAAVLNAVLLTLDADTGKAQGITRIVAAERVDS